MTPVKDVEVLLVEDDPGDIELIREGLDDAKILIDLHVVDDGIKAMKYLRREGPYNASARPELIILDLNLPKKDGRDVLLEIKKDEKLKSIPVVVLTTSASEEDFNRCYELGANCCITKPIGLQEFMRIVQAIHDFWVTIVKLPAA
ncbi:MAG: response regulator [Nitrospirae bacterium]|nr:response regulator [Nitrospirota bacterium]